MTSLEELIPKDFMVDGKYKVVLFIKRGDNAGTYRVKSSDGKLLFLKLFELSKLHKTSFDSDGNVLEIEILKKVSHINIVNYEDSGEVVFGNRRFAYLVLDFIVGETLADHISRRSISTLYDIKFYLNGILNGLKYLHSLPEPIVHNEVTLSNIVLDLSDTIPIPKLIDFGFARPFHRSTKTFNREGIDLYYLATESFNNIFSPQSDLFSAGALLYHLIYGFPPRYKVLSKYASDRGKMEEAVIANREKQLQFSDASESFPDFDDSIKNIIIKALHKDTELRYKSADEFLKALNGEVKEMDSVQLSTSNDEDSNSIRKQIKQVGNGFSAIAGMKTLKHQLKFDVIDALLDPEEYQRYDVTIPNGILLYGPPRCGKTFFAQRFAEEVGFNFVNIKPSDLQSKFINATQENIRKMFEQAERNSPSIIFLDELDALVPNREGDLHQMHAGAVNEFLAQMNNTGEKGIFIIGATNRPEKIDPAILGAGRLDKKFYVPPPDFEARKALFELYLKRKPLDFGIDYEKLSQLTHNYVSADIKLLVDEAARQALKLKERISMEILEGTIKEVKPSIPMAELHKYEQLRRKMEGQEVIIENKINQIGFKRAND